MTQNKANLLLASVAVAWGSSYLFMKLGLEEIEPFHILALRCGIAFFIMAALFIKKLIHTNKTTLIYSAVLGSVLFATLTFVLAGISHTSASSAGFLTSTAVIMVPILQAWVTRTLPGGRIIVSVLIVSLGLVFLMEGERLTFDFASLYCLVGALLYAIHIIATKRFVQKADPLQLGIYQLGFAAILSVTAAFLFEEPALPSTPVAWISVLGLALICSAYCYVAQPIAQKHTTPEAAGFLFALEPISSAMLAFLFLNEMIGWRGYLGAALVLLGVLLANSSQAAKAQPAVAGVSNSL